MESGASQGPGCRIIRRFDDQNRLCGVLENATEGLATPLKVRTRNAVATRTQLTSSIRQSEMSLALLGKSRENVMRRLIEDA